MAHVVANAIKTYYSTVNETKLHWTQIISSTDLRIISNSSGLDKR